MRPRTFNSTERIGVNAVEKIVTKDLHWIWREQNVADFGVDGQIEAVDQDRTPTGKLFAVQVKTGKSYFRGNGATIPFYVDEDHLKYWDQHALPVILVIHNPEDGTTLWQWADSKTARPTETGWCIDVPKTKFFDAPSKAELKDQFWMDDSVGLRRRFALDREFMKEFEDRDSFVTIDKWVNKHLQYREIEVRFDAPHKLSPDYTIPIMATWHFDVPDVMRHFLPWLEYEYYEEPDESSGEVEGHVMAVYLSKPAKAFLELEAFFENPPAIAEPEESEPEMDDECWYDVHSLDDR